MTTATTLLRSRGRGRGEEHEQFAASVRRFLAEQAGLGAETREVLAAAGEQGYLGIAVPEQFGGSGVDDLLFGQAVAQEAFAAGAAAVALRYGQQAWVALPFLARYADDEQRADWLPGLASGERTIAVVDAGPGSDLELVDNDSQVGLSGCVRAVVGAGEADLLLVVTGDDGAGRIAVVDAGQVVRHPLEGELGIVGSASADVTFEQVVVPAAATLAGDVEQQRAALRTGQDLWLAVLGVAGARAALDLAVGYVGQRQVFGQPLSGFANTRRTLAEVAAVLLAAEALVSDCIGSRASGSLDPARAAASALAAAAVHGRAVDQALQLHGGYGYMREYPIAQAYADAERLKLETVRGMQLHDRIARSLGLVALPGQR